MRSNWLIALAVMFALFACNTNYTLDKKRGYFKIDFPEKQYRLFDTVNYPYTFEYPVYARIVQDSTFFEDKPENPYWINIDFPQFEGRVFMSYKEIGKNRLDSLVHDAYTLSQKQHVYKASGMDDSLFRTRNGIEGVYFSLMGNTATANQFFLTDTTTHFLRGALYFDAVPNEDSLKIVNDFLKADLFHLINTLKWKD